MTSPRTTALRLHAIESSSRANGPGRRYVVWFQGCSLGCPGCYNPETHEGQAVMERSVAELVDEIADRALSGLIDGLSFSGGEPLEQAEGLLELVTAVRERTDLSVLVFSGFRRAEIERMELGPAILASIDVLVDGRFVDKQRLAQGLRGSENQRIHVLTERLSRQQVAATPVAEVKITAEGDVILSGVDPLLLD